MSSSLEIWTFTGKSPITMFYVFMIFTDWVIIGQKALRFLYPRTASGYIYARNSELCSFTLF